jgi:cyanate lyase
MTLNRQQADKAQALFDLTDEEAAWLQIVPYKGSLESAVPTDPLIYRWYEIVSVYGTTIKELIHEEFGDGIMRSISRWTSSARSQGRRQVVLSGKYKSY